MVHSVLHSRFCSRKCSIVHHVLVLALLDDERTVKNPKDKDLVSCVKSCVNSGWDPDSIIPDESPNYQLPLLYLTAILGKAKSLAALLKYGLNVSIRTKDGETVLHGATRLIYKGYQQNNNVKKSVYKRIVSLLLQYNPKLILARDNKQQTVLHKVSHCLAEAEPRITGTWAGYTGKMFFYRDCLILLVQNLLQMKESNSLTAEEVNGFFVAKDEGGKTFADILSDCLVKEAKDVVRYLVEQYPCLSPIFQSPVTEGEITSTGLLESPHMHSTMRHLDSPRTNSSQLITITGVDDTDTPGSDKSLPSPASTVANCDVSSNVDNMDNHPIIIRVDSLAPEAGAQRFADSLVSTDNFKNQNIKPFSDPCTPVSTEFGKNEGPEMAPHLHELKDGNEKNYLHFVLTDDGLDINGKLRILEVFYEEYSNRLQSITDFITTTKSEIEAYEKEFCEHREELEQLECQIAHRKSQLKTMLGKIDNRQAKRKSLLSDKVELGKKIRSCEDTKQSISSLKSASSSPDKL